MVNATVDENNDYGLTDLTEALRAPGGQSVRTGILGRLAELEARVSVALKQGVSPAEFTSLEKFRAALVAARDIVVKFK